LKQKYHIYKYWYKMASPSLPKRGRPKLGIEVHRIGLRMDVYNEWQVQKDLVGMAEKTHSEFASHLLKMCEEMRVRENNQQCSTPSSQSQGQGEFIVNYTP
jgi:hypothetical protein